MNHEGGALTSSDMTHLHHKVWAPDGEPAAVMAMLTARRDTTA
jgi:hypothetical protein